MAATPPSTSPPSRWRQFSLRSLLLLILLCGIGLGLWSVYIAPYQRQRRLVEQIAELKGVATTETVPTSWSSIFGEGFFINIVRIEAPGTQIDDAWMANMRDVPRLRELNLSLTPIGDAGLAHVTRLEDLQSLWLGGTKVTDAGLVHIQALRKLEWLSLAETNVTDQGLASLANLNRLKRLYLEGCPVGDGGMRHIEGLVDLEWLDLRGTRITDESISRLVAHPKLATLLLDNTDVTEACLADLKKLPALMEVSTSGTHIIPSALREALPKLHEKKLAIKLAEPTLIEFVETPLQDLATYLEDYHRTEIRLDRRGLDEVGVKLDSPITKTVRGKPLSEGLREILEAKGLKCGMHYGVLMITNEARGDPPPRLILKPGEKLSRKFSAALYAPMAIDFTQTPLVDGLAYVSDYLKTDVVLTEGAFPAGFGQTAITHTSRIRAADGLELLFHELDVHGVIEINMIRIYPGPVPEPSKEQP
jgi:hypothetical protein